MTEFLNHVRYCSRVFPPYRFIPGATPHPTEDPKGHSFGHPPALNIEVVPNLWFVNETYLYGIDLYNHGYWWEAHESWESLWKASKNDIITKDFFQGLIKISGAMLKWQMKKFTGMELLYSGGIEHLKTVCLAYETYMGLDLMGYIAKLHEHFQIALSTPNNKEKFYKNYPYIVLERETGN